MINTNYNGRPVSKDQRGRSQSNAIFNWQPFALVERLPEEEDPPILKKGFDYKFDYNFDPNLPQPVSARDTSHKIGASMSLDRAEPWSVSQIYGNAFVTPALPFNPRNRALTLAQPRLGNYEPDDVEDFEEKQITARIFQADVIMNESYQQTTNATSYPIDRVGNVSDHSILKDFTITITAMQNAQVLSSNPLDLAANFQNAEIFETISDIVAYRNSEDPPVSRLQYVYDLLVEWQRTGQPLAVRTKFAPTYVKSMTTKRDRALSTFTISRLSIPRNKDLGRAMKINVTLKLAKQILLGTSYVATYDVSNKKTKQNNRRRKPIKPKGPTKDGEGTPRKAQWEKDLEESQRNKNPFTPDVNSPVIEPSGETLPPGARK